MHCNSVVQHCDPPYRAIRYSCTYRINIFFSVSQGIALYPPFLGVSQNYVERGGGVRGGVWGKPALCAIGRYRGVSQLYCRKSRLDGPLSLGSRFAWYKARIPGFPRKSTREGASGLFGRGPERPQNISCSRATQTCTGATLGLP